MTCLEVLDCLRPDHSTNVELFEGRNVTKQWEYSNVRRWFRILTWGYLEHRSARIAEL